LPDPLQAARLRIWYTTCNWSSGTFYLLWAPSFLSQAFACPAPRGHLECLITSDKNEPVRALPVLFGAVAWWLTVWRTEARAAFLATAESSLSHCSAVARV